MSAVSVALTLDGEKENDTVHSVLDIAAGLAEGVAEHSALRGACVELKDAIVTYLEGRTLTTEGVIWLDGALDHLVFTSDAFVRYGARLGYALALTEAARRDGWEAWLAAAMGEIARSGCSIEGHVALRRAGIVDDTARLSASPGGDS